ncbi:MAG: cell division protein FtsA [Alloprevotella sp.]|nr:cell division protein FtsA [Alloprevotella sp.]
MATEDNFIVAIELGSSKVTGIAGRKQPDGALQILALVQEPSSAFIRKGRINNIVKMRSCIGSVKEKLEKSLKKRIDKAYVGIGGMGMHTVAHTVLKKFTEKTVVSKEIVEEIQSDNYASQPADKDILEAITQEYKLGAQTQLDPVGIPAESIEGYFLNVVTKREVRENINNCVAEADLEIAGMPITFLALADEMVPEPERHSGCVFVDMGAETTSVAVFKNNILRHLAVIPLGGRNITRDITSLSIEEGEAERLKLAHGSAFYDVPDDKRFASEPLKTERGHSIPYEEFCNLVEARQEEIIKNVKRQIELSKYDKNQLVGGIIVTGGAANMPNMEAALRLYLGFDKIQFVKSVTTAIRPSNGVQNFNRDGSCNAAIALLESGTVNCCGGDLGTAEGDIFTSREEIRRKKEQEEAERKAKAEADRIAQEEEARQAQEEAERQAAEEEARIRKEERSRVRKEKAGRLFGRIRRWAESIVSDDPEND